jgi:uncharacterized protein YyaL (SSP411 family)
MNRLAHENSPYLLQHAQNPVDWHPWGAAALGKARAEDKPIFLSIGYAACHWCHVMEHESFEDAETAAFMNAHFINIKVDREERPDLDSIYMKAVTALTGHGGWPLSAFLTPDGEPFYGGTYFPPVRRYNMPAFREVLQAVADAWARDRSGVARQARTLTGHIQNEFRAAAPGGALDPGELAQQAVMRLAQGYDWKSGGWGSAPKFPQPMVIEFLLRRATRGDKLALDMAAHALDAMAQGGMYDAVGGGFARYSVDDRWLVPHFEKMLYDNAQLALAYLHGWLVTGKPRYRAVVEETLAFMAREMLGEDGGFYASLDADSRDAEGHLEEGAFYVWTPGEIAAALSPAEAAFVTAAYGVTEAGNFEGRNVLRRAQDDTALAAQFGMAVADVPGRLAAAHTRLLAARGGRARPAADDKTLVMWNALALAAFSEAGRYFGSFVYKGLAMRNAGFLLQNLRRGDGRLLRSWREGRAQHLALLEDYAALVLALLSLYQTDPDPRWFAEARRLADEMLALFSDPAGRFFDTGSDHEALVLRPRDVQDNATPCGNSLACAALLQLAAYTADGKYRDAAEALLSPIAPLLARHPTAFGNWLCASDFAEGPAREVAILGEPSPARDALTAVLWQGWRPRLVAAISEPEPAPAAPPLLRGRPLVGGAPTAYVCEGFVCKLPVTREEEMRLEIGD